MTKTEFSQIIKKLVDNLGYSQSQVVKRTGISRTTINNAYHMEQGRPFSVKADMPDKLFKAFPELKEEDPDEIFSMEHVPETLRLLDQYDEELKYLRAENERLRKERDTNHRDNQKTILANQETINRLLNALEQVNNMLDKKIAEKEKENDKPTMISRE